MQIECKELNFSYKNSLGISSPVLTGVSANFTFEENVNILGLVIPFGCGKSTLLKVVAGIYQPDSGTALSVHNDKAPHIIYIPADPVNPEWLTLRELLTLLNLEIDEKAKHIIDLCGLDGYEDHLPSPESRGFRLRIQIAVSLIAGGELLLLDEPFSRMENASKEHFIHDLTAATAELQCKVILATSDLAEAYHVSDAVYIASDTRLSSFHYVYTKGKNREALKSEEGEIFQNLPQMLRI